MSKVENNGIKRKRKESERDFRFLEDSLKLIKNSDFKILICVFFVLK